MNKVQKLTTGDVGLGTMITNSLNKKMNTTKIAQRKSSGDFLTEFFEK